MNSLKEMFRNIDKRELFTRIKNHNLDIFVGRDHLSRYTLLLLSVEKPSSLKSTKIVNVDYRLRDDGKWALTFSLTLDKYKELYLNLCQDLIESSRNKLITEGTSFISERYIMWQQMLEKYNDGLLSYSEVKGLIGELYFLKNNLFNLIGIENTINSWVGPMGADQDFRYLDEWFEVKTTTPGSTKVRISSVEQLDDENEGHLIILYLDKTSYADANKLSLNTIVNQIYDNLDMELVDKFKCLLLQKGYTYRKEYDDYSFKFYNIEKYKVDKLFPCLRNQIIPISIANIKYDLLIATINEYMED